MRKRLILLSVVGILKVFTNSSLFGQDFDTSDLPCYSGMFNERGLSKSSSANLSGNEIINNFNGNLLYQKTLFDIPGKGDLKLKIELTYNGSVPHVTVNKYITPQLIYSLNLPEWIISVNGIAVQVFNFEDYAYNQSDDETSHISTNRNVSTFVSGYHSCGRMGDASLQAVRDLVRILKSDGSVQEFYRADQWSPMYEGKYYSSAAGDFNVGYIHEGDPDLENPGDRLFCLKTGDGTTVKFQEYVPVFKSGYSTTLEHEDQENRNRWKPKVFYLDRIEDRFGNYIQINYSQTYPGGSYPTYGHIILDSITTSWGDNIDVSLNVGYDANGLFLSSSPTLVTFDSKTYELSVGPYSYGTSDRFMVSKIKDPEGRETVFTYDESEAPGIQMYIRKGKNLQDGYSGYFDTSESIRIYIPRKIEVRARRINEIYYADGGKAVYDYLSFDDNNEVDMDPDVQNPLSEMVPFIQSMDDDDPSTYEFHDTGRDPFFINMVKERKIYENSTDMTYKTKETYNYPWQHTCDGCVHNNTRHFYNVNDEYTTELTVSSSPEINESTTFEYTYENKFYQKLATGYTERGGYHFDLNMETKLMSSVECSGESSLRTITYEYHPDPNHAFLYLSEKTINELGRSYEYAYSYNYLTETDESLTYATNVTSKTETSPLNIVTETQYLDTYFDVTDENSLYINNLIDTEEVKELGIVKRKAEFDYFTSDGSDGYKGQLWRKQEYPVIGGASFVTSYKYSTDTYKKGQLKEIQYPQWSGADPDCYKVYYFYNVDGVSPYRTIYFTKQRTDGSEQAQETVENGYKFPLQQKVYPYTNVYFNTYQNIDRSGNMLTQVDANRYGSEFEYDDLNRISRVTLPHDFHTVSNYSYTAEYDYDDDPAGTGDYEKVNTHWTQRLEFPPTEVLKETFYRFDGLSRLYEIDKKGTTENYWSTIAYDYRGLKESDTNENTHITSYQYDELERLTKIKYHDNNSENISYSTCQKSQVPGYPYSWPGDDFALKKTVVDENNHTTSYYYDALDQLRAIDTDLGGTPLRTYFEYDALGNVTKTKDPSGLETLYEYDALGRLIKKASPDLDGDGDGDPTDETLTTPDVEYMYDKNGNLRFIQDAVGRAGGYFIYYKYDGVNRKIVEGICTNTGLFTRTNAEDYCAPYSDYEMKVEYKHDTDPGWEVPAGSNLMGRLAGITYMDQNGLGWGYTTYSYDSRGRIDWVKQKLPGGEIGVKTIDYGYNSADLVTRIAYNDGESDQFYVWYDYDEFGRNDEIFASTAVTKPQNPIVDYTFKPLGQVEQYTVHTSAGDHYFTYSYTDREWMDQITPDNNRTFWYNLDYDNAGNVTAQEHKFDLDRNGSLSNDVGFGYTLGYDDADRLISANSLLSNDPDVGYSYYANGRIKGLVRGSANPPAQNYFYKFGGSSNQLQYISGQSTDNYDYDASGNTIKDSSKDITDVDYDHRNLPTMITIQNGSWFKYGYDALGNRVIKKFHREIN